MGPLGTEALPALGMNLHLTGKSGGRLSTGSLPTGDRTSHSDIGLGVVNT